MTLVVVKYGWAFLLGEALLFVFYQRFNGILFLGMAKLHVSVNAHHTYWIIHCMNMQQKRLVCLHAELCLKLDFGSSTTEKME